MRKDTQMKKCVIIGAGVFYNYIPSLKKGDFVIAADGGFKYCKECNLKPDLIIGDRDSLIIDEKEALRKAIEEEEKRIAESLINKGEQNEENDKSETPETLEIKEENTNSALELLEGCESIKLPTEKNDTDTLAAIRIGIKRNYEKFHILGGTGGRLDHTIANMQCLVYLSKQKKAGFLYDEKTIITAVTNGTIQFPASAEGTVSVFAADENVRGVSERGLKYSLNNYNMTNDFPIGVSNSFKGVKSTISVRSGTIYVIFPIDVKCEILFQ